MILVLLTVAVSPGTRHALMSQNLDAFGDLPLLLQVAFIFTVAGSALLFAVHALLRRFGFSPAAQRWALPAVGTALGATMILPFSDPSALGLVGLGALYAALTSFAWLKLAVWLRYGPLA